jgi:hypothetical protein
LSAISWREHVNFQWNGDEVRFVLDQHAELDFYSASSLKQGERTIFVDEFQDAASKDGDWLIIGKFTESVEWSNRNYSAVYDFLTILSWYTNMKELQGIF